MIHFRMQMKRKVNGNLLSWDRVPLALGHLDPEVQVIAERSWMDLHEKPKEIVSSNARLERLSAGPKQSGPGPILMKLLKIF